MVWFERFACVFPFNFKRGTALLAGGKHSYEHKSEIWVMNADGSDKQCLLSIPFPYGLIGEMAWSPDGTRLAFVWKPNYRLGGIENPGADIYLIDVPAS